MNSQRLFDAYPTTFFRPLAGQSSQLVADCLENIWRVCYEDGSLEPPAPTTVYNAIRDAVELREGVGTAFDACDDDDDLPAEPNENKMMYIYRRLCRFGWLGEEKNERRQRVVTMPPQAALTLRFMSGLSSEMAREYGGDFIAIYASVMQAQADPGVHGLALKNALRLAQEIKNHTNVIVARMKDIQREIVAATRDQDILRAFFDRFVEGVLIKDYKKLHTEQSPFRFRGHCREALSRMLGSETVVRSLACAFEQQAVDVQPADSTIGDVCDCIEKITRCIDGVMEGLNRIEKAKGQLERRIHHVCRHMNADGGQLQKEVRAACVQIAAAACDEVPVLTISRNQGVAERAAYHRSAKRNTAGSRVIVNNEASPEFIAYGQAMKAWHLDKAPTLRELEKYAEEALLSAGGDSCNFAELPKQTPHQLSCIIRLAGLPFDAKKPFEVDGLKAFGQRYRVVRDGPAQLVNNGLVETADFRLVRSAAAKRSFR